MEKIIKIMGYVMTVFIITIMMMAVVTQRADALIPLNDTEVDDLLLNSIERNHWRLSSTDLVAHPDPFADAIFTNVTFIRFIDYAEKGISVESTNINRAGAFGIVYEPMDNNNLNIASVVPDNFTFQYHGFGGFRTATCTDFHRDKSCIVHYELTDTNEDGDYQEFISIYQAGTSPTGIFEHFNMTLALFQFESRSSLTFRELALNQTDSNTLLLQGKILGIFDKFDGVIDISYELFLIAFWLTKAGIIMGVMLLIFTIPLKLLDFFNMINKKYFSKREA